MRKFWMSLVLGSLVACGLASNAMAQDCGMRDDLYLSLKKDVNAQRGQENKMAVIRRALSDTAITTQQALTLLNMVSKDRTDVAIELYRSICDPDQWYQFYTNKNNKGIDVNKVASTIWSIEPKGENYNYEHHPDWYKTGNPHRGQGNNGWHGNRPNNCVCPQNVVSIDEYNKLKAEVESLRAENDRLKHHNNNVPTVVDVGMITINTKPAATIYIDGTLVGTTPISRLLPVGSHSIDIVHPNGKTRISRVLDMAKDNAVEVRYDLNTNSTSATKATTSFLTEEMKRNTPLFTPGTARR